MYIYLELNSSLIIMYVRGVDYVCINMYLDLNEHNRLREWLIENSNPVLLIYLY